MTRFFRIALVVQGRRVAWLGALYLHLTSDCAASMAFKTRAEAERAIPTNSSICEWEVVEMEVVERPVKRPRPD